MDIAQAITELESSPSNTRFARLVTVCTHFFGEPRIRGSHHIFRTPWQGDPRINIQAQRGGRAAPYQVRQVIAALKKHEALYDDNND